MPPRCTDSSVSAASISAWFGSLRHTHMAYTAIAHQFRMLRCQFREVGAGVSSFSIRRVTRRLGAGAQVDTPMNI